MSKPSTGRPSTGGRPSPGGGDRPSPGGGDRPSIGGGDRPSIGGGDRPSPGGGDRPSIGGGDRPSPGGGDRPGIGSGQRPGGSGRPSADELGDFLHLPGERPGQGANIGDKNIGDRTNVGIGTGDRTNIGNQTEIGGDRVNVGDRNNVGNRVNTGDRVNVGDRDRTNVGDVNINTGDINVGNKVGVNRENNINSMRNRWTNVDRRPFDNNWWQRNSFVRNDPHWRWQSGWAGRSPSWFWKPCTWAACGAWFTWGASWGDTHYPYNYGTNVVYRDNYVYINDQQYASTDAYYQQAETIAESVPQEVTAEEIEWMPLGIFAVAAEENATDSGMLVQLAVSKEGIIAGTFYNDITGSSRPLEGMVHQTSQRAAWKFADDKNPEVVMEAGIYDLTLDEATALVHFNAEQAQTWLMVRLPEPEEGGQ